MPRTSRLALAALAALAGLAATAPRAGAAPVNVAIDTRLERRVISPLIYGVNFGSTQEFTDVPYPSRRWGGNSTTRYNWQNDTHNTGSDWFFLNEASGIANPATLPDGSEADLFLTETRTAGAQAVLTIPTIGWTPVDRVKRWGYSVARYGAQQATECTASNNAFWCAADAGNGVRASDHTLITGNDPHETSVPVGPDFAAGWLDHLHARFGAAASGGVKYYALDNEPALWNSTHHDVHPNPLTYDELWQKTFDYSSRIKQSDPSALVMGPVSWGWCEYFYSAADGCGPGADAAAHGNLPLIDWYLQNVQLQMLGTRGRLVDLLDIHYYPQDGSALNDDESATTAARRLREVKSLYDPAYVDESWIGQPVMLIPRMKSIIAARCPGTGLAITEYNFGGDTGISSALAQAEALALFGREGVDLATRWVAPQHGTRVQDAFKLYLSYDGAGAHVTGVSCRATSDAVDRIGAYAIDDGLSRKLHVLLFNKSIVSETAHLAVADGFGGAMTLYRFTAASALAPAGSATLASGTADLVLPARSATLAVIARPASAVGLATPAALNLAIGPNPFRGAVTITFELPRAGDARVGIYGVDGRRVRTLASGAAPAGTHTLAWDGRDDAGRDVAPGVFLCRVDANGASARRGIVRVR